MTVPTRTDHILIMVELERDRQRQLFADGKIPEALDDITIDDVTKLAILIEEVGEVAKEINDGNRTPARTYYRNLLTELVQVAAVAAAWAESANEMLSITYDNGSEG